jgi:hypothetical protein
MTCLGATGTVSPSTRANGDSNYDHTHAGISPTLKNVSVEECDLLLEKTPIEWTPVWGDAQLDKRISGFTKYVETGVKNVAVVVGHSQYFRRMLNQRDKFDNCDIWECVYTYDEEDVGKGLGRWDVRGRLYKGNDIGDNEDSSKIKEAKV